MRVVEGLVTLAVLGFWLTVNVLFVAAVVLIIQRATA